MVAKNRHEKKIVARAKESIPSSEWETAKDIIREQYPGFARVSERIEELETKKQVYHKPLKCMCPVVRQVRDCAYCSLFELCVLSPYKDNILAEKVAACIDKHLANG